MPKTAFDLRLPDQRNTSVVFASPHSGRNYPRWFLRKTVLNADSIRSSEDAYVDRLFDAAPKHGAPLLLAGPPRAFVDLNRSHDEWDAALIDGAPKAPHNPRVASGLGVIPRVVSNGRSIYHGKITMGEAQDRIDKYWHPYHAQLGQLMDESVSMFGQAILVDCHSMPHEAVGLVRRIGSRPPEIVLGDRFGSSASGDIVDRIEAAFKDAGLHVLRNAPFAGAYVTQTYGRPSRDRHAIQIEIDRSLYLNELRVRPNSNFRAFRALIRQVIAEITEAGRAGEQPLAAE